MYVCIRFNNSERASRKKEEVHNLLGMFTDSVEYARKNREKSWSDFSELFPTVCDIIEQVHDTEKQIKEGQKIHNIDIMYFGNITFYHMHDEHLMLYFMCNFFCPETFSLIMQYLSANNWEWIDDERVTPDTSHFTSYLYNSIRYKELRKENDILEQRISALREENNRLRKECVPDVHSHKI